MKVHVQPYAGYHQFYVTSDSSRCESEHRSFWSKDAVRDRLAVATSTIAVGTDTYGHVPVDIEILDSPSTMPPDGWDHIVESSIDVSSGQLEVSGCPDPDPLCILNAEPGVYAVRVFSRGLSADPDDGGDYNGDEYVLHLWRATARERSVIKRFSPTQKAPNQTLQWMAGERVSAKSNAQGPPPLS
jgi:hypothetical protein